MTNDSIIQQDFGRHDHEIWISYVHSEKYSSTKCIVLIQMSVPDDYLLWQVAGDDRSTREAWESTATRSPSIEGFMYPEDNN